MKNDDNGTKSQSRFSAFVWRRGDNLPPRISKLIVFSLFFCNSKRQGVKKKKVLSQASLREKFYKKETKIYVNIKQEMVS